MKDIDVEQGRKEFSNNPSGESACQNQYFREPEVEALERKLARFCGVKHAVACASGDDALLMALTSYDVGPGDAIFTTPFNDVAAVSIIRLLGATPIFVDIDPFTFNLDPEQLTQAIEALDKGDTSVYPLPTGATLSKLIPKGIISADLFGLPADYDAIRAIAERHGLFVIEDGSQAFGAEYQGRHVGSLGDIGLISFSSEVPLGAEEGGGMCLTDQDHLAARMRSFNLTEKSNLADRRVGRMTSGQAASLLANFEKLPEEIKLRREVAKLYTKYLDENPLLVTPYVPEGVFPVWSRYSLLTESDEDRSNMIKKLKDAGFAVGIYYARPLYLQDNLSDLQYREGDFPVSDDYASRIFSVPMHAKLTITEQENIADILNDWE